jgi:hypothetical protein
LAKETVFENDELESSDDAVEAVSSSNWLLLDSLEKSKHIRESPFRDDETACLHILVSFMTALLALAIGKERPSVEAM